ncbi:hypothetical protein [Streptomyces sp. NBC_01353]|uniref:hypothetical protein n=1 Tax=Streptomyces sp. NBC_01353 TaxID=2903835 RepID=UPI002E342F15|nr:hypothetical protein [Streptomyces sp. NBC_01353]
MSASVSALVVAIVGVAGTLASGLLAHRSATRAKQVELQHLADQQRAEQERNELREMLAARRASYALLNQAVRHFHDVLANHRQRVHALTEQQKEELGDARRLLRDAYAEAQMIASDAVLVPAGQLVTDLNQVHAALIAVERWGSPDAPSMDIEARLTQASASLYSLRQRMRADLGITNLPMERRSDPGGHAPQSPATWSTSPEGSANFGCGGGSGGSGE